MIQKFVAATPDIQGAALVTPDGLSLTSVLPTNMDEERTAAMSAAMLS
ncbi:MAG: roadblock/LC7 domain-containing protein, partial [Xenococcaceae cyanobacterium MO_207.B15]|nr:roadblock/LC7 domain-containing protein [Xenococcaceae cyanobacterium MO_207.B15]